MKSQIQDLIHHPGGAITINGAPNITIEPIARQGHVKPRDLERELGLPHFYEEWESIAAVKGMSRRCVQFIVADESLGPERTYRLQPSKIRLPKMCECALEFGHYGFLIGSVHGFFRSDALQGFEEPAGVTGDYIIGQATLFESELADIAWEALNRGILTHACPLIFRTDGESLGAGELVEVSLVTDDNPGFPSTRVLDWVEVKGA